MLFVGTNIFLIAVLLNNLIVDEIGRSDCRGSVILKIAGFYGASKQLIMLRLRECREVQRLNALSRADCRQNQINGVNVLCTFSSML